MEFMKIVMEVVLPMLLALLLITQVLLPTFISSLPFFWLFKKNGAQRIVIEDIIVPVHEVVQEESKKGIDAEIDNLTHEVSENADRLKKSTGKVDEVVNKLTQVKNDSLNNLNNTHNE